MTELLNLLIAAPPMDLEVIAKHLITRELSKRGMTRDDLNQKLQEAGFEVISSKALINKINNGTFSLTFFLQCMIALGVKNVSLEDIT